MKKKDLHAFLTESNRIEGLGPPDLAQEQEAQRFLDEPLSVESLCRFVSVNQRGAVLRDRPGLDVRVGYYFPPRGGPEIRKDLLDLLHDVREGLLDPHEAHCQYETLHPFTDCNGRSGRILWLKMMGKDYFPPHLFLQAFYYQTLERSER